jgi:uncharacterized Fe-S center protein
MGSKVCFTDMRAKPGKNLLQKLSLLIDRAGIGSIDFKDKFVAIKVHVGEPGNLAYMRPNFAAIVVSRIKELGGKPFITDANTLYTGRRSNAVDHIRAAEENGFNSLVTGCNFIVADGLRGTEYREIPINLKRCKTAKIGSAIADADIVISLNHFKGHEMGGFGGAVKNLGMGSGSRGGKLEMHSASKPVMDPESCVSCGVCIKSCSQNAISFNAKKKAEINYDLCIGCGQCVALCMYGAAQATWNESADSLNEKIAEYAFAVVNGKPQFHVNFIMDVSPNCDCWGMNDAPIVPNIGIAASLDPVALDVACIDMVNAALPLPNTVLSDKGYAQGDDKFTCIHSITNWRVAMTHGESIGLGSTKYEIETLKI